MIQFKEMLTEKGKGKAIAREFFLDFKTPAQVTAKAYEFAWERRDKKNFVVPKVQKLLSKWKKAGFIETKDIKINVIRPGSKPYVTPGEGFRLNFEPFYSYCNEVKKFEFTEKEKEIISLELSSDVIRKQILEEHKDDDVINAIIKYYIKINVGLYDKIRYIENIPKENLTEEEKNIHADVRQIKKCLKVGSLPGALKLKSVESTRLFSAILRIDTNSKEMIESLNDKFKKALGIL